MRVYSQCFATRLQNFSILQNWNSIPIKLQLPTFPLSPGSGNEFDCCTISYSIMIKWNHTLFLFLWLAYLLASCLHGSYMLWNVRISFRFKAEYFIECICHILLILLSARGHLGCFHLLAIVNNAALTRVTNIFLRPSFEFLWVYTQKWNS